MATSHIIVGSEGCPISKVVCLLKPSATFHLIDDKLIDIALELGTSRATTKKLKIDYFHDKINLAEVVYALLEDWIGRNGSNAELHKLIQSFENIGLKECAERLTVLFSTNGGSSDGTIDKPKMFNKAPNWLQRFLRGNSKVCLVHSPDVEITCDKIRENVADCYIHGCMEFVSFICSPVGRNNTAVDIVKSYPIKYLQQLLQQQLEINHKLIFVTVEDEQSSNEFQELLSQTGKIEFCDDHMNWNELSIACQLKIKENLNKKFKIEFDKEEFHGKLLVDLMNSKDVKLFKDTLPQGLSYYVARKIISRYFISFNIFEQTSSDIFLFTGMERYQLSDFAKYRLTDNSTNQICLPKVKVNYIIFDQPSHFDKICMKTSQPVHLLNYKNGRLGWIKSEGELTMLQKCVDKSQEELEEDEYIQKVSSGVNRTICLSDSPGMGKSVLLAQIGRRIEKMYPGRHVFFIVLGELINLIKQCRAQEDSLLTAIESALKMTICENVIGEVVLTSKLYTTSEEMCVELLLDGFDEVDSADSKLAIKILQTIKMSFKSTRLWMSTRPHMLGQLENNLNLLGFNIQPFCNDDQIQFLTLFWQRSAPLEEGKILKFAQHCLDSLKIKMNTKDRDIAGIPLQCLLIGEVYEADALEYAGSDAESMTVHFDISTITELYHQLIEKKLEKYEMTFRVNKLGKNIYVLQIHLMLSLELLFPEHSLKIRHLCSEVDKDEVLKVGIVESTSTVCAPRFIHRTFAEYFIAWFMIDKLSTETHMGEDLAHFFLDVILERKGVEHEQQFVHGGICYFINSIIPTVPETISSGSHQIMRESINSQETMLTIALACVHADFGNIFNFFHEINAFDQHASAIFTELSLSIAIQHSSMEVVKIAFIHFEKHHQFGSNLKIEVLKLALKRGKFSIVEFLIKEKGLRQIVENLEVGSKCLLHLCCKALRPITSPLSTLEIHERVQVMWMLVGINSKLLEEVDDDGRTPLLSHGVDVRLRIELIRMGANVFAQDRHGDTVLHNVDLYSGEDYHTLLVSVPEETLGKLVQLKWRHGRSLLMHVATKRDKLLPETVARFKKAGADFNVAGEDGYSLMAHAIRSGVDANRLRLLIQQGADVDWKGSNGNTLLHVAAGYGNMNAIKIFLEEYQMDVNWENEKGKPPLNSAIKGDNLDAGKLLHECGGIFKDDLNSRGQSFLHLAAKKGELKSIQLLLLLNTDVNGVDEQGNTPLHCAVQYYFCKQYLSTIKLILKYNANPNLLNKLGETPFETAMKNDHIDLETIHLLKSETTVKWTPSLAHLALKNFVLKPKEPNENIFDSLVQEFKENGVRDSVNYKGEDKTTLLHLAAKLHNEIAVKFLLLKRADVNTKNKRNETALHVAALENDFGNGFKILLCLMDHGADAFAKDKENFTFLHYYILSQNGPLLNPNFDKMITYLKEKRLTSLFEAKGGADGNTPLQLAICNGTLRNGHLTPLYMAGVKFTILDNNGASVLSYAIWGNRSRAFLNSLIQVKVDWKSVDNRNCNMLHIAARFGKFKSLKFFLHFRGLDINGVNKEGNTPLHQAILNEDRENVLARCELLVKYGANVNIKNRDGNTPLELAMSVNCKAVELIRILDRSRVSVPRTHLSV